MKIVPFSGAAGAVPEGELRGAGTFNAFAIAVCFAQGADTFLIQLDAAGLLT